MINLNNLPIEDIKLLLSSLNFYHGMYPDNTYFKEQIGSIESLKVRLQSLIEESESPASDTQVPMRFCQYGGNNP